MIVFIDRIILTLSEEPDGCLQNGTLFYNVTIIGWCIAPAPLFEDLITESLEALRRNRCFDRLPSWEIRRADSSWALVNSLGSPLSSWPFTKGTASVSLIAMHNPKWHAVVTSTDTICSAYKRNSINLNHRDLNCKTRWGRALNVASAMRAMSMSMRMCNARLRASSDGFQWKRPQTSATVRSLTPDRLSLIIQYSVSRNTLKNCSKQVKEVLYQDFCILDLQRILLGSLGREAIVEDVNGAMLSAKNSQHWSSVRKGLTLSPEDTSPSIAILENCA